VLPFIYLFSETHSSSQPYGMKLPPRMKYGRYPRLARGRAAVGNALQVYRVARAEKHAVHIVGARSVRRPENLTRD